MQSIAARASCMFRSGVLSARPTVTAPSSLRQAIPTSQFSKRSFADAPQQATKDASPGWDVLARLARPPRYLRQPQTQLAPADLWASRSEHNLKNMPLEPKDPYAGRSVPVRHGQTAAALSELQRILGRNKVQHELRMTARHEKKGYKRRRLASESWRRNFANEVRKKVKLVREIRARGA
ncbi:hypothetical protein EWM64_g2998 [Hericium alpestre]|uniref:Ribosomal protein S21 n=1 Tax=Hericium alpestre TaxID=135208 RepID=A0A4Z0A3W1_9AGAM|nr:hypothetical protein EWM64_g2998 [Hericium alpestre]